MRLRLLNGFLAVVVFYISSSIANAADLSSPPVLSKERWKIAKVHCPVGCSREIRAFLNGYIGQPVEISSAKFVAPFIDDCNGEVRVVFKATSARAVVNEINKGIGPGRKMTVKDLAIRNGSITSAIAYCKSGDTSLPIARIISIEPSKILVLFEQQSIVELR